MSSPPSPLVDRVEFAALVLLWKERFAIDRREAYHAVTRRLRGVLEHPFPNEAAFKVWLGYGQHREETLRRKLEITLSERFHIGDGGKSEGGDEPLHSLSDDRLTSTREETLRDMPRSETREFVRRNRAALEAIERTICSDPALRRKVCTGYLRWLALVSRRR